MAGQTQSSGAFGFGLADDILRTLRSAADRKSLRSITRDFSDEIRSRYFALVTHEDLRAPRPGTVDLRDYAEGAERRIVGEGRYRRDPVMRGCLFADSAFLWSELRDIITLDHRDRIALELGRREGLNEGITVPCGKLGYSLGSCTFAGFRSSRMAELALAPAQMFGSAAVDAVGSYLDIDMADWWQADACLFELVRDREVASSLLAENAGDVVAKANAGEKAKTVNKIARDHLEGANGRAKVERWVPRWMRFPPAAYTTRGGVASVAAAGRAIRIVPDPEPEKLAA